MNINKICKICNTDWSVYNNCNDCKCYLCPMCWIQCNKCKKRLCKFCGIFIKVNFQSSIKSYEMIYCNKCNIKYKIKDSVKGYVTKL